MRLSIEAYGTHADVAESIRAQIKRARTEHPTMHATLASLTDDLAKRSSHAPGETVKVHVDLTVDISVVKTPSDDTAAARSVPKAAPAPSLAAFTSSDVKSAS